MLARAVAQCGGGSGTQRPRDTGCDGARRRSTPAFHAGARHRVPRGDCNDLHTVTRACVGASRGGARWGFRDFRDPASRVRREVHHRGERFRSGLYARAWGRAERRKTEALRARAWGSATTRLDHAGHRHARAHVVRCCAVRTILSHAPHAPAGARTSSGTSPRSAHRVELDARGSYRNGHPADAHPRDMRCTRANLAERRTSRA